MAEPLAGSRFDIDVMKPVTLGKKTYRPGKSLIAQATDDGRQRWLIGPAPGVADTIVDLAELLRCRTDGSVICSSPR